MKILIVEDDKEASAYLAKALKEAAMKNAEATIIDKYSAEVKSTLNQLLEQDELEAALGGLGGETLTSSTLLRTGYGWVILNGDYSLGHPWILETEVACSGVIGSLQTIC